MEIFEELKPTNDNNLVLILGFFDGLHLGHRVVIRTGVEYGQTHECKTALISFKEAPAVVLNKKFSNYIMTYQEKIKKLEELGIDYLFQINFNEELSKLSASDYLKKLIENFHPKAIITGDNHYFGYNRTGSADYLELMQNEYGYEYFRVNPIKFENTVVSSSQIRSALESGDIKLANFMLGYRFYIQGEVIKGRQIGRSIGFKTANINYPEKLIKIPDGVYAVEIDLDNKKYMGIANYGSDPTVTDKTDKIIEVHILNFNENIYGKTIKINFLDKIRDEIKFQSLTELKQQIAEDIKCLES